MNCVLNRTCKVELDVLDGGESLLDETSEQFRHAVQYLADYGWSENLANITDSKSKLNDATYEDVREATAFTAKHVQAARALAAEVLTSCRELYFEEGQNINKPMFRGSVVVYDGQTITFNGDHYTISTTAARVTAEYVFTEDTGDTPFETY